METGKKDVSRLFFDSVGKPLERSVPLREHSHFEIGGNADFFFKAVSLKKLIAAVRFVQEHGQPFIVIGSGTNILFDDEGFRGLVIKNCAGGVEQVSEEKIRVTSGTPLKDVLQFCIAHHLAGLEFLAGIPGTAGGAVVGNAGAFGQETGEFLEEAVLLDGTGREKRSSKENLAFGYRDSILKRTRDVLLSAVFSLKKDKKRKIVDQIEKNLRWREQKLPPPGAACAGSFFKNPVQPDGNKVSAASLLEKVGAKSLRIGGAGVHPAHANFIVNLKGASAREVLQLAAEMKRRVMEEFGIFLEEEVIFLPATLSRL